MNSEPVISQNKNVPFVNQNAPICFDMATKSAYLDCPCQNEAGCVLNTGIPVYAIVPAAGQSTRMCGNKNKPFIDLQGTPVIIRTLRTLAACPCIQGILVIAKENEIPAMHRLFAAEQPERLIALISGGATRQDSVFRGIRSLSGLLSERLQSPASDHLSDQSASEQMDPIIAIHDGARCLVTRDLVCRTLRHTAAVGPCAAGVHVKDTIKIADMTGRVQNTLDRSVLFATQTPQVARLSTLFAAFSEAEKTSFRATDDLSVLEVAGYAVDLVQGDEHNIKLTTPFDLLIAKAILETGQISEPDFQGQ